MAENMKLEFSKWEVLLRLPWIGQFHLFWHKRWWWHFSFGRCDYGTLVILFPGFWFAYSDPGLRDALARQYPETAP